MRFLSAARIWVALVAPAALALGAASCSGETSKPPTCGKAQPAFALTVQAEGGGTLPDTTLITVKAGGGVETFVPASPEPCPSMVFCVVVREGDAGAPAASDAGCVDAGAVDLDGGVVDVTQITCSLWTDGAAEVKVEAPGFVATTQQLKAKTGACGIETEPAMITVTRKLSDGGMLITAARRRPGGRLLPLPLLPLLLLLLPPRRSFRRARP